MKPITTELLDLFNFKHVKKPFVSVCTNNNITLSAGLVDYLDLKAGNQVSVFAEKGKIGIKKCFEEDESKVVKFLLTPQNKSNNLQFKSVLLTRYLRQLNEVKAKAYCRFELTDFTQAEQEPLILTLRPKAP